MRSTQELDPAELPGLAQGLGVQKFPSVDGRLHHHVGLAGPFGSLHERQAFLRGGGHGHGASHVLPGFERR